MPRKSALPSVSKHSSTWKMRLRAVAQSRILKGVEKEFETMVNQIRDFRKGDRVDSVPSSSVIHRRLLSVNLSPANSMNMEFKEYQRRAIYQKYARERLYSEEALLNRWFYFLSFELDGNRIRAILADDQSLLSRLEAQQKGRKWKDARVSDYTGACITERLCEKHLPELELNVGTIYKRIRKWKGTFSPWIPFWKERPSS